ncbi:hypothetical protein M6D81_04585 [Paenibacillus sp. J5C_2022]|nr:hypothetical protein [Paenibacillus sp. J5C2022]
MKLVAIEADKIFVMSVRPGQVVEKISLIRQDRGIATTRASPRTVR